MAGFYKDALYAFQHPLNQFPVLVINLALFIGPYIAFRIRRRLLNRRRAQGRN